MLVMVGEGGETKFDTNINFLLEEFGVMVNNGGYPFSSLDIDQTDFKDAYILVPCRLPCLEVIHSEHKQKMLQ